MAQPVFVDYYHILDLKPSATTEQIRAAYLRLAKQQHPDKGGDVLVMRKVNQAYATLRDVSLRQVYDVRYRKSVLGQRVSDLSFTDNDDWDLDDVDDFLNEVYRQDRRRQWLSPLAVSAAIVGGCLLIFMIIAISRMTTSNASTSTAQALSTKASSR